MSFAVFTFQQIYLRIEFIFLIYVLIVHCQSGLVLVFLCSICKGLNALRYEQRFSDGMQAVQLPHLKNEEINPKDFTLENFYKLYTFLCPREDLDNIFTKM